MSEDFVDFKIRLEDQDLSDAQLDNFRMMLRHSIIQDIGDVFDKSGTPNSKGIDPGVASILAVTVLPTMLTKFLEFLHAWAIRRESRNIRVKIQLPDESSIEIEVPQTSSPEEIQKWIQVASKSILQKSTASKKR